MLRKMALVLLGLTFTGCVGVNPPHLTEMKPYTLLRGGDQVGRDQLANRWMVGESKFPIQGWNKNEVTTLLGQPQSVKIREHRVAEDWFFIYYKNYKLWPQTEEGSFVVRFHQNQVFEVVKIEDSLPLKK